MKKAILFIVGLILFIAFISMCADYQALKAEASYNANLVEAYDSLIDNMDDDYFIDVISETDDWQTIQSLTESHE